ncbi:peptidylprolyl isomerase [Candidatus Omnitrophota bacterium]
MAQLVIISTGVCLAEGVSPTDNIVVLETNQGDIEIELMYKLAPKACENFVGLVRRGYYDGLVFHRVIRGFMIQAGDPSGTGEGGTSIWGRPFEDEVFSEITFDGVGLVAMANSGPDSNNSQFFITTAATPWLNMRHTIFGRIVSGYDTVQKIEAAATDSSDRPVEMQGILSAYVK